MDFRPRIVARGVGLLPKRLKYNNIYKTISQTQENIDNLQKIQYVVISYLNSKGSAYPTLETELKNVASMEAEIAVFLSYSQEQ